MSMTICGERFEQLRVLGVKHKMPQFSRAQLESWREGRAARVKAGTGFKVLATGTDGCAEHVLQSVVGYLREMVGDKITFVEEPIGWAAMERAGLTSPLENPDARFPDTTWQAAMESDAILFCAVGAKWDDPVRYGLQDIPPRLRPQMALMQLRFGFDLFANVRPAMIPPSLFHLSPLRPEFLEGFSRVTVVRELTAGEYFGSPSGFVQPDGSIAVQPMTEEAVDTVRYTQQQIERVLRFAFELAKREGVSLTSLDKANVWNTSKLWRRVFEQLAREYPSVAARSQYFDDGFANLATNLPKYGVITGSNFFGDGAGDIIGKLTVGSLGMIPSGGYGDGWWPSYYEPVHGSAIDIFPASGRLEESVANPLATVLSAEMLLRDLGLVSLAQAISQAVNQTLEQGWRTPDIFRKRPGETKVGTMGMMSALRGNTLRLLG